MAYKLRFKRSVQKDLKRIGRENAARVLAAVRLKLLEDPRAGKQLHGELSELWSFRAGAYRVAYTFNDSELWILVVGVGHRKDFYKRLKNP